MFWSVFLGVGGLMGGLCLVGAEAVVMEELPEMVVGWERCNEVVGSDSPCSSGRVFGT